MTVKLSDQIKNIKEENRLLKKKIKEISGSEESNGQQKRVFTISIDDGYVEYSYGMEIDADYSIAMVEKKIRRALRCKKAEGKIRKYVSLRRIIKNI